MRFWRKKKQEEPEALEGQDEDALAAEEDEYEEELSEAELEAERAEVHEQTERAVERTKRGFFGRLASVFERADFDESLYDDLEEILLGSDAGLPTTEDVINYVRETVKKNGVKNSAEVRDILREELIATLEEPMDSEPAWAAKPVPKPLIILVVGVNGAGKTTTIAKMAHAFSKDGASVILGAADTFRAAASDQLKVWGDRAGVRVIAHQPGADPGAVVFDTIQAAQRANSDIVIIDTAGRLHTKTNLMEELKKINRVVQRSYPDAPHETLLVLDATTGQNGMAQARTFTEAVGVTGIVLAKLDGTARGGMAFAICYELGIPVRFIGTGERMTDLAPFDPAEFVDSLLG